MRGLGMGCAIGFVLCISSVYIEKSLAYLRSIGPDTFVSVLSVTYINAASDFNRQVLTCYYPFE